jgi:hydroxypyruvate isomerase
MHRREFARTLAGAALGGAISASARSLPAAPQSELGVPFKFSVMLWTVYRDRPFEERMEKIAEAGYHSIELVDEYKKWSEVEFRAANAKRRSMGIGVDAMAGLTRGVADPAGRDAFLNELSHLIPTAHKLDCPAIIVLSGDRIEGQSREAQRKACIDTLKRAGDAAGRHNITLLLENIDPEENPKYFLTSVAEGFQVVRDVKHPKVQFLYDFYHEQIAEGNLIAKLEKNIEHVGLVHVADVPGRHEPGTGEINYPNIFRKLADLKYGRYVAMEFQPSGDPVTSLRSARDMATRAATK